jgi:hypothetical protein
MEEQRVPKELAARIVKGDAVPFIFVTISLVIFRNLTHSQVAYSSSLTIQR